MITYTTCLVRKGKFQTQYSTQNHDFDTTGYPDAGYKSEWSLHNTITN